MILALLLTFSQAHAGQRWTDFCKKYIAAEDPWPFAEEPFADLLDMYFRTHSSRALEEITHRMRYGPITEKERAMFWQKFRGAE